ncbi:MAG TPA: CusA/CzcA family heavy metal efflux RND transporter [Polyangiaceae bacterium]|jgi:cobalt-zinc-cadmium resistance protein CzcA|nr:CusA/CzcA family heavy metal efflux RND transporter [Polyangiaceae bacterium]
MSDIVAWSAKNPLIALLIAGMIALFGVVAASHLPIDAVPDVTNTQVQVVTRAPALSATEVEAQISQRIERDMAGIPGLKETRSISKFGISVVTLVFTDGTDVYFARSQVTERLIGVRDEIPEDVGRPELGPISTALGEIYMFELKPGAPARSTEELRTIVDWQIAPKLRQVPGVVEVVGYGGAEKQYRVTLDPARLAAHGVSFGAVRDALERDNRLAGGGFIEHEKEQIVLRGDARFRGIEDVRSTVVRTDPRGATVRVGHLGEVDTGPGLRQGAMTRDGRGEIVGASVLMLKGENSRSVVAQVKEAITALGHSLPAGVTIEPYYDRAEFIDRVLVTITRNLSEGALIVVGCLLLTLGSLRAGLLVAGAIPFSMLVGFIGLHALGYSGNVMSLGAIDFGVIVEGGVLMVEHAMSHGASETDRRIRRERIVTAMRGVAKSAVFVVVITLLVFLPLSTLEDVEGKMFRPVVYSLSFMLFGAILYALLVIPAIAPVALRSTSGHSEPWLARKARGLYVGALDRAIRRPKRVVAASFAVTALMLASGSRLGADFLPRVFEGAFAIDAMRQPSSSLGLALELGNETERALKAVPEVDTVVNRIGRPEGAVDPAGPESSDVFVMLKPRSAWRHGVTPESLMSELSNQVNTHVPATMNAFSQPIEMRVNDLVAGVKSDVAVKIYGDDLTAMNEAGEKLLATMAATPGAADFKMEIALGQPSIQVRVDRDRLGRVGVSPGDVLDALALSRAGLRVGQVREGERVFDLTMRLGGDAVSSPASLSRLPVSTTNGSLVPMALVSDIEEERTVIQISREQMKRRLVVQGNVRGRDLVGFVKEAQGRVAKLELPKSVEVAWGGQFQNFNRAKERLALLVPVSLAVIALMLFMMFQRFRWVAITILGLPFGVAGGTLALALRGLPFSIPAGVGFIALAGISVCTGIVLTTNLLAEPPGPALGRVRNAALASFRAILTTALLASIGFVPAAMATGAGSEVQRPLATVVIGGLVVSTFVSLLALPALLLLASRESPAQTPSGDGARFARERLAETG